MKIRNRKSMAILLTVALLSTLNPSPSVTAVTEESAVVSEFLAFPTAEGAGRFAKGGRGGEVIHVTSLADDVSREGTLRWAVENAIWQDEETGGVPRIVVFDVGGVIPLTDTLTIPEHGGNLYIAGQTAPGSGITLTQYGLSINGASDVIIRDLRVRPGDYDTSTDGISVVQSNNVIVDHCSVSWAGDEAISVLKSENVTFQWNILGESIDTRTTYEEKTEALNKGATCGGDIGSYHHNLLLNCTNNNFYGAGSVNSDMTEYTGRVEISNNVVYNWQKETAFAGASQLLFYGNYYKAGAASDTELPILSTYGDELGIGDTLQIYTEGNVMLDTSGEFLLQADENAWDAGRAVCRRSDISLDDICSNIPLFDTGLETESAEEAYLRVLSKAGAGAVSLTGRDQIDEKTEALNKGATYTYVGSKFSNPGIIDSMRDTEGYPDEESFTHSTDGATNAENDTDRDGMPDVWELAHGLNPEDAFDGAIVSLSAEHYTNTEMYLNELMGDPISYKANDGKFTASFIQSWLCRDWTLERWQQEFAAASDAGMDALILQSVIELSHTQTDTSLTKQDANSFTRSQAYSMYPTTIESLADCTLSTQNSGDALALALEAAKTEGMQLWIGTISDDRWWNYGWGIPELDSSGKAYFAAWSEENATLCANVITELETRYGEPYNDVIAGYYYVNEVWNIDAACAKTDGGQYAEIIGSNINASLAACGERPLMISPFFNPDLSNAEQYGGFWSDIFETAEFRAQDVFAHQDGGGRECSPDVIREWAGSLKASVDAEAMRFWINNETFQTDGTSKPIADLRANYDVTTDLAEEHILFSWNHYYNPHVKAEYQAIGEAFTDFALEAIDGDVNADGLFTVADVVALQKWLLAVPDVKLADRQAADLCEDDVLNVFDLCVMKRMLIYQ